jgi:hypothetical protein
MTTCMTCQEWSGKGEPAMAKLGFGLCTHEPRWVYRPPQWSCKRHRPAERQAIERRQAWLRQEGHIR